MTKDDFDKLKEKALTEDITPDEKLQLLKILNEAAENFNTNLENLNKNLS